MDNKKPLLLAAAAWLVLVMLSFWAAIYMGWGPAESEHAPSSVWMYIRRGLMIAFALLVPKIAGGKGAEAYGWKISKNWLLICIPLGIAMGFGNPGGFDPRYIPAVALACLHSFATEIFFRAYLITTLSQYFKKFWPPIVISSVLYGFFYLTVWSSWSQPGAQKLIFVGLFTGIGLLHGYCYKKSESLIAPWLIHFLGVLKYRLFFY